MQLDRTEIVIKQRPGLELFDLSLLLLKRHWWQVILTSSLLGVPLLALDVFAVWWMLGEEASLAAENFSNPRQVMWNRHTSHLVLLFVLQFQLISLPTTVFLGNVIFYEKMPIGKLIQRLLPIAWRTLFALGILRFGLINLLLVWFINRSVWFDPATEIWMLFIFSSIALLLRASWPFAPEILGLECCKLKASTGNELSYWQRSKGLHNALASENFGRFILAVVFSISLTLMIVGTALFFQGLFSGYWLWNAWFDHLILPLSLWMVGWFMSVFRFLAYLDSRIRLEGWEIELQMRAESVRLTHVAKPSSGMGPTSGTTSTNETAGTGSTSGVVAPAVVESVAAETTPA